MSGKNRTPIETITHAETRTNIPPAEFETVLAEEDRQPIVTA